MALSDYLNSDTPGTTAASSSTSAQLSQLLQQAQAKKGVVTTPAILTLPTSGAASQAAVQITVDAQRANAASTDAAKDAAKLLGELRAAFDKQYGAGNRSPGVSALSGRALAMVALNDERSFSRTEVAAAKAELRERDRASALAFISSGELTAASLKSYSQQLLAARETMSAEERALRDIDPNLR